MRGLGKAVTIVLAGSAALAGTVQAQSLSIAPVKPCYLSGERVTITAAGFTPGGLVDFTLDSRALGPQVADAAGTFVGRLTLGGMRGAKSHGLTATDRTNPAIVANAAFLGTTRQVVVKPQNADAGTPRRLKGYGFMNGQRVYMHVRGNGYSSDKRIAKPSGPCGTFATQGDRARVGRSRALPRAVRPQEEVLEEDAAAVRRNHAGLASLSAILHVQEAPGGARSPTA